MLRILAATAVAAALYLLCGCGQTGPLYLPEEAPQAETAAAGTRTTEPS